MIISSIIINLDQCLFMKQAPNQCFHCRHRASQFQGYCSPPKRDAEGICVRRDHSINQCNFQSARRSQATFKPVIPNNELQKQRLKSPNVCSWSNTNIQSQSNRNSIPICKSYELCQNDPLAIRSYSPSHTQAAFSSNMCCSVSFEQSRTNVVDGCNWKPQSMFHILRAEKVL